MKTYIVLDLEWNQSPIGKEGAVEAIPFEIIEIGAVKLDEDLKYMSEFHSLVRPVVYRDIHHRIHELIHIDIKELRDKGKEFVTVIDEFKKWCYMDSQEPVFCTWGAMDLGELQRNIAYHRVKSFFDYPLFYYDVQKLFTLDKIEDPKERLTLEKAVRLLEIPVNGVFHHALEDAHYTSIILGKIDFESLKVYRSLDLYKSPGSKEEEIYVTFPEYAKYVSRGFSSREALMEDKTVKDMLCCKCNRMLRKKVRWFVDSQKNYYCMAECPEHGYVRGKIRIRNNQNKEYYAVKSMRLVDKEEMDLIKAKKEQMRLRRKNIQ